MRRIFGSLGRGLKKTLKGLFFLLAFLYILLWIPWVQVKIGHIFAYTMSQAWDTKVTLERVEITPLYNFKFHNFFIQDHDQDTLIYAKYAEAQSYNVFSLFKKRIDIGNVIVKDAVFKVQRRPEAEYFNIHFLIAFFEAGGNTEGPRPKKFELYFGGASLTNARVHLADTAIGTAAVITCDTAYVHRHSTEGVDMIGKKVWGNKAHLEGLNVTVSVFDKVDIPGIDSTFWEVPYDSTIPYWDVGCEKLLLERGSLKLINARSDMGPDSTRVLDFANLNINNIGLDVDSFRLQKEVFTGKVNVLTGLDHGGFHLKNIEGDALISPTKLAVTNFKLETNNSTIGHALVFKYKRYGDFYEFPDKVKILGTFDSTTSVTFRDIAALAPVIQENVFIKSNLDNPIAVKGKFRGTFNNFRAKDVDIRVGKVSHIEGNLSMNDITIPDAAFMDLNLKNVTSNYSDLKQILSFVNLPPNVATLGQVKFQGSYTGFFQDFVAYGQLDTRLGRVNSDVQLNIRKGKKGAAYKGGLKFSNFDVGTFIGNEDVGRITVHSQVKGKGLTLETLDAELQDARIDSFTFKDYQYKDIRIDGLFKQKRFDGDIISRDTNMNVFIRGIVDLNGQLPSVDILGNIQNINFKNVNISQEDIGLHLDTFDINATGNNLDNFTGNLSIRGVKGHRGDIQSELNHIRVEAKNVPGMDSTTANTRVIHLNSDILDVNIYGEYDVVNLVKSIEHFIKINHPNLYRELNKQAVTEPATDIPLEELVIGLGPKTLDTIPHQEFNIIVTIPKNTKNITQLIDKNFKSLEGILLTAEYHGADGFLKVDGKVGGVQIGDIGFKDIEITKGIADGPTFQLNSAVGAMTIKDSTFIPNIQVNLNAVGDSVHFRTSADAVGGFASDLDIQGKLEVKEKLVVLKLDTSELKILGEPWAINDNNHIKIGDKVLDIQDVVLSSNKKRVSLSSINNSRGAKVTIENMDLGWLYSLMEPLPKIEIDGIFSGDAVMEDVFTQKDIHADILIDTLIINDDYWGSNSTLTVRADSIKSTFQGLFTHSSDFVDSLYVTANFTPEIATKEKFLQNLLDINATAEGAKAKILEYFLKEQISETQGNVNAQARIFGNIRGKNTVMNIEGDGEILGAGTKVNFLNTKYLLEDGKVKIDNKGFHIDPPLKLIDGEEYAQGGIAVTEETEPNDTAYIGGSLVHDHLKDFGLDIIAVLDNNLAMKTTIEENSTFYGTVYASGTVNFKGPFERLKLKVNATTEDKTDFNLPIGGPLEVTETNYITFVDKKQKVDSSALKSIKDQILAGLDIEIIANIKPSAIARLIIDEKAGDIIEGRGQSDDMRIHYSPTGELKMFGTYEITEGKYLFTYKNLINKPFAVKPGGTITWGEDDGNPYKAQLNINANYTKNLGVSNLVKSYTIDNPELSKLANTPCKVDLDMGLNGELFSPEIDFKLRISDVDSRLQTPVDLALRTIHADNNELNRQVFGIIALQQFLPLDNNFNVVSSGVDAGISTISELVSQQLSLYINDLLEGVIKEVDFISSLEFDFNFNVRDSENQNVNTRTSNVRIGSDVKFLNDKLRVYAGANVDIAGEEQSLQNVNANNGNYIGGDFIIEYSLTNDGQLKVKAYNRTESSTILGQSTRTGIGLSYKKEFNTLQDLIDEAKENRYRNRKTRYTRQIKKFTKKVNDLETAIAAATEEKKKAKLIAQKDKFQAKLDQAEKKKLELEAEGEPFN